MAQAPVRVRLAASCRNVARGGDAIVDRTQVSRVGHLFDTDPKD